MRISDRTGHAAAAASVALALAFLPLAVRSERPQEGGISDSAFKARVLEQIASLIETEYVLPDEALLYAGEFRKSAASGSYDSLTDAAEFADSVTAGLRRITGDQHITFRIVEPSDAGEAVESALHHPVRYHRLGIRENRGFFRLEWMGGNVGYFDLRRFYYYPDVREMVTGAMSFLSNSDAIIIDLRENGGGSGDYLSSYFLPHPTQLSGNYSRKDDLLTESWTEGNLQAGPFTEVPLFILTSRRTFSAAESFAYDMQALNRATIVGEATRGGAHSVDLYPVEGGFEIYISTARAISPVTGGNWEGTGVIPDVRVSPETALDTALVLAREAGAVFAASRDKGLGADIGEMQVLLERAEDLLRAGQDDAADAAIDSMFEIAGRRGMVNEFFIDVLAYNYFSPGDEPVLYAVLKKKTELYPGSPAAHESLAWAYYRTGRMDDAIACYTRVLELDPGNSNARNMIDRSRSARAGAD